MQEHKKKRAPKLVSQATKKVVSLLVEEDEMLQNMESEGKPMMNYSLAQSYKARSLMDFKANGLKADDVFVELSE